MDRSFKRILARAGLSSVFHFHDLRHTCATLLLAAGVHVKAVAERLGHSSIRQALETSTHVLPAMEEWILSVQQDVFFPSLP